MAVQGFHLEHQVTMWLDRVRRAERDLIRLEGSVSAKVDALQTEVVGRHRAFEVSGATVTEVGLDQSWSTCITCLRDNERVAHRHDTL